MNFSDLALQLHETYHGNLTMNLKDPLDSQEKLSSYYTPGVGRVSEVIASDPKLLRKYTWVNNLVAVISDGSAVLGLGNIGPKAAMPVMEGKAMLFKHFADVDAIPIVLDVHETEEIIAVIKAIAPSFGGINLEDIAAPKCFEIEDRLKQELDIPIFHDDQHGTAIVVLAGLINAMKVVGKKLSETRVVIVGAGAAGVAVAKLLKQYANPEIIAVDSKGILDSHRTDLNETKRLLASFSKSEMPGALSDAVRGADIFIGVSVGNLLTEKDVRSMSNGAVIFAMANPYPEILPETAKKGGAAVIATGRSDFPNQVNNALAFPAIFRGALDNNVRHITDAHKIAAAEAIAALIDNPTSELIIPSAFDKRLVPTIAKQIH